MAAGLCGGSRRPAGNNPAEQKGEPISRISGAIASADQNSGDGILSLANDSFEPWRKFLVGTSPAMEHTAEVIRLVGVRRATVLITGETGTGKEMVARAVHYGQSPREYAAWCGRTATHCPKTCWKRNCSATSRAPSPERFNNAPAASSRPTAARCFWTKSAIFRWTCRPNCCECCRSASSSASAAPKRFAWTCA